MGSYSLTKATRTKVPYSKFMGFMIDHNVSQGDVAEVTGKSRSTINQNLNGTAGQLSLEDVRKICEHWGISSDEYFVAKSVSQ